MKPKDLLKKLFIVFLVVSGLFFAESQANSQTATARFSVVLKETDTISDNKSKSDGGCYVSALKNEYSENQIKYLAFTDVFAVTVTITGQGISAPIILSLTKSSSGYYAGIKSNLPAGG